MKNVPGAHLFVFVFSLCLLLSLPALADSGLSGLTVSANWDFPAIGTVYETSSPSSQVVGPSDVPFIFGLSYPYNTAMDISVSASTNTITLDGEYNACGGTCNGGPYANAPFNGFVISVLNPPVGFAFTGVKIQSINWDNETPVISFDNNDIYVNMAGLSQIGPGSDIVLSYAVPEPGSLVLMASGVLGIARVLFGKCGIAD